MRSMTLKRSLSVILSIVFILSVLTAAVPLTVQAADPTPVAGGSGYITDNYVNLRSGSGTNYSIVTQMMRNTKVTFVDGKLYNSDWYKITEHATNKTGFVKRDYVMATASSTITLSNTYNTIYVGTKLAITAYDVSSVTWSTSDASVAVVDGNGIVTAKGAGKAIITARSGSSSGTCTVVVKNGTAVDLSKSSQTAYYGNSFTLTSSTAGVKWYSCNTNVVTVSNGFVKAVGKGYATVSAYTGTGSATCLVHVIDQPAPTLRLSNTNNTIYKGTQLAITAYDVTSVSWTSSDVSVAEVDSNGIVTAKGAGLAAITARSGSKSGVCLVNVKNGTEVNLSESSHTDYLGNIFTLTSTTAGVKWYSCNKNVATVSNGVIKAVGKGYATISAYTNSGSATCLVHVIDLPESNEIKLSNTYNTIYTGTQLAITAYNVSPVTWSTTDSSVAVVNENGIVTAKGAGTAEICAKSGAKMGICKVVVKNGTAVNISKTSQTVFLGNSITLSSTTSGVKWYSCNPSIATVSNGVVKTISKGYVTISAYTSKGSATCLVNVTDPPESNLIKLSNTYNTIYTGTQLAITAYDVSSVTWSSSNSSIAEVNNNGIVTAKGEGTALITAKSGSKIGNCTVVVKDGTAVNISKTAQTAYLGNSFTLTSSTSGVKWYSCNKSIATVSNGVVKAVEKGYVTISAYTSTGSATCLVHVIDPPDSSLLKLSNTYNTIYKGTQLAITAYDVSSAEWSSSDTSVATVDGSGIVTAKGAGSVLITAKSGSKIGNCRVIVKNGTTVNISKTSQTAYLGNSFTLSSTTSGVKWYSCNPSIATVSNGVVKTLSKGYVTISAYTSTGSATCLVHVIDQPSTSIKLSNTNNTIYAGTQLAITAYNVSSVTWKSSNTSVATVDNRGVVTAVAPGNAVITATSGGNSGTCNVKVLSNSLVNISSNSITSLPCGKSILLKSTTTGVKWYSSNRNIAVVNNGVVDTKATGLVTISAYTSYGSSTCLINVTSKENVRFVYATPNSSPKNSNVTFNAITDLDKTDLYFMVSNGSTSYKVAATSKKKVDDTLVWSGSHVLSISGKWNIKAYSKTNASDTYSTTKTSGEGEAFVTNSSDMVTTVLGERRASDQIISLIADYEGFLPVVTADSITSDPTVGYGKVVTKNEMFYNNLNTNEAYAYLCQTVNSGGYTTRTNAFLTTNSIKFNQRQFDALVCFAYNVGSYAIYNDSDLQNVLLSTGTSGTIKAGGSGYVNDSAVNLRSGPGTNYSRIQLMSANTAFTFVDGILYNSHWYRIKLTNGTEGYIYSDYATASGGTRDLKNVNMQNFVDKFFQYHHASGSCYWGLLYRRIDEGEIFFYGDYVRDGQNNKKHFNFTCRVNGSFSIS